MTTMGRNLGAVAMIARTLTITAALALFVGGESTAKTIPFDKPQPAATAPASPPAVPIEVSESNLGYLTRLIGRDFAESGTKASFSREADGSIRVPMSANAWFILRRDSSGQITAEWKSWVQSARATFIAGQNGFKFEAESWAVYYIAAPLGDIHVVTLAGKQHPRKLSSYQRMFAPRGDASLKLAMAVYTRDRARAELALGFPLAQLDENLDRAQPETAGLSLATASASIPAQVPTNESPTPVSRTTGPRVALVVANARYTPVLGALPNPANDGRLVAGALRAAGFQVEVVTDADQRAMKQAIARLGQRLGAAGRGATGLFYYAGHGVQSKGVNYLMPVNAEPRVEADVDLDGVAADTVLRQLEDAGAATSIVILDACRDMPLAKGSRSAARGLARMDAPGNSYLVYSTAPGQTAADGDGTNSPFASALAAEIGKPNQPIEMVFRNVRRSVLAATANRQTPWVTESLSESFVFTPR